MASSRRPVGLRNHKLRPDTNVLTGVMLVPDPRAGARDPAAASRARTPDGDTSVGRASAGPGRACWSPWQTVVGFGVVSLAADMVYEGARSVYGPLLGALGASALVVGAVIGAGEAAALIMRVVSGPWADRTRRYWTLTIAGYALTAVCVPLLALTPFLGAAGLVVAAGLILDRRYVCPGGPTGQDPGPDPPVRSQPMRGTPSMRTPLSGLRQILHPPSARLGSADPAQSP